jgi:hypothetical protein
MAVTGTIGQEDVVLNDAATESTLKQLVAAVGILSTKSGTNLEYNKEVLHKFYDDLDDATGATRKFKEKLEESTDAVQENKTALGQLNRAYDEHQEAQRASREKFRGLSAISRTLIGAFDGLLDFVSKTTSDLMQMGNSASGAVNVLNNIPGVGSRITKAMGPAAESADKLFDSFINASQGGATFGGSITQLVNSASAAGLTVDEFTGLLNETGPQLALLGEGATEGAKRLGRLGQQMRVTGVSEQLTRLGISTAEQNKLIAKQAELRARTGRREQLTDAQLIAQTVDYAKNLSALSKLTGENREALQAQRDAMMADAKFRQMLTEVDPATAARLEAMMMSVPEGMRAGAMELFSTGVAQSQAAADFLGLSAGAAQAFIRAGESARATGTFSQDQVVATMSTVEAETKKFVNSGLGETIARFVPEFNDFMTANFNLAQRAISFEEAYSQAIADIEGKGLLPEDLAAEDIKNLKENITEVSNNVQLFAASALEIKNLNESVKNMKITFDNIIGPVFDDLNTAAGRAAEDLTSLAASASSVISPLSGLATGLGIFALAVGGLGGAFLTFKGLLSSVNRMRGPRKSTSAPDSKTTPKNTTPDIEQQKQTARAEEARRKGRGLSDAEMRDVDAKVDANAKRAGQTIGKEAGEAAGKGVFRSLVKKIPVISLIAGTAFTAERAFAGDFTGAALEMLSGLAATVPGLGTSASVGIDATLAARDMGAFDKNTEVSASDAALAQLKKTAGLGKTFEEQGAEAAIKLVEENYGGRKRAELLSLIKQASSSATGQATTPKTGGIPANPSAGADGTETKPNDPKTTTPSTTDLPQTESSTEDDNAQAQTPQTAQPAIEDTTAQNTGNNDLQSLNTNITELIGLMRSNNQQNNRIISGLAGLSNDLYSEIG